MADCESLFNHLKSQKMVAEKYLVRRSLGDQQVLEQGELDTDYFLPGLENPVDGTTENRSDMISLLRLSATAAFHPGILRPLQGVPPNKKKG